MPRGRPRLLRWVDQCFRRQCGHRADRRAADELLDDAVGGIDAEMLVVDDSADATPDRGALGTLDPRQPRCLLELKGAV